MNIIYGIALVLAIALNVYVFNLVMDDLSMNPKSDED